MADIKRQPARIASATQLLKGKYVEQDGWEPNYVDVSGVNVSRVNLMGIIVDFPEYIKHVEPFTPIESFSCTVDDGTDIIQVRSFDPVICPEKLSIGTPVLIIGRPRKYNEQLYVALEIIRALPDKKWLDVRKKELKPIAPEIAEDPVEKVLEEIHVEEITVEVPTEMSILDIIDFLDTGDGVMTETVIAEALTKKHEDPESKIKSCLLNGDIFEVRPGRIKVLK
ncbi:MAG: hypothetical protein ACI8Y7_001168 [Candidatus Woesearchaeota archaeon]|jgi:hypothetical protein